MFVGTQNPGCQTPHGSHHTAWLRPHSMAQTTQHGSDHTRWPFAPCHCCADRLLILSTHPSYALLPVRVLLPLSCVWQSKFRGSGHSVAASRLAAMDSLSGWANEQMGGFR